MRTMVRVGIAAIVMALSFGGPQAQAGPILTDTWYGFCFGDVGSAATPGCQNLADDTSGNSFTFASATSTLLKVTDAFQHGDRFDVYDFGVFLFTTSLVPIDPNNDVQDPDLAFADPSYSSGSFHLAAGLHSIDIFTNTSPFGGGGAYLQVVPEPSTLMLLGGALVGLAALRRRA